MNILKKIFGTKSEKDIKALMPIVQQINQIYATLSSLTNEQLREKSWGLRADIKATVEEDQKQLAELKAKAEDFNITIEEKTKIYKQIEQLQQTIHSKIDKKLDEILPEAFAIVKETARRFKENTEIVVQATDYDREFAVRYDFVRIEGDKAIWKNSWMAAGTMITWDMVHFDVQLMGGIVLHQGKIAEMATGEGKTLVATLPLFLNGLSGRGCHLVTVNDYLAKRDCEWMGPIYMFHGLTVDCIDKYEPHSPQRRQAYMCDITYGTNNEYGFDYLRDNMVHRPEEMVQREHIYAIVDEVDSVLIDEARTPLIISGPVGKTDDELLYTEFKPKVAELYEAQKRLVNQLLVEVKDLVKKDKLDEAGVKLLRAYKGLPKMDALVRFLSEQGMKSLLQKTENIYLQDNARRMPEITDELYFVIDEKLNSVDLTDKGHEFLARHSEDPDFFVIPDVGTKLAEIENDITLSKKEKEQRKEALLDEHKLKSERIHVVTQLIRAYAMFEKDRDYVIMDGKVKIVDEHTGRILEGRRYSEGLHQAIEAKENVKVEETTQTYATITLQNYFRMYRKLAGMTGTAATEAQEFWDIYKLDVVQIPTNKPVIRIDYDDKIYRTKREKYNAIIEEIVRLRKEGRAVLVGTTSVEVSELLSKMLKLRNINHNVLNAKYFQKEAEIVAQAGQPGAVTIATNMAGRGTDIKLHPSVREAGGLAIIGSERHEARRIDNQLRGRAGRQGDPGSSQFYVSLEDDLMRIFGSESIARVMDMMNFKEGEVIQHPLITKSIERAQKKVEENNYGIRKRLLEFDDVMNVQRKVIYTLRKNLVFGQKIDIELSLMIFDFISKIINANNYQDDYHDFRLEILKNLAFEPDISEDEFKNIKKQDLIQKVYDQAIETFNLRMEAIRQPLLPFVRQTFEEQAHTVQSVSVLISDSFRIFRIMSDLKAAYETQAQEIIKDIKKIFMLVTIDEAWKEHLRELDDLKQAVNSAAFEQKDPLVVYKIEAFNLFQNLLDRIYAQIVSSLFRAHIYIPEQASKTERKGRVKQSGGFDFKRLNIQKAQLQANTNTQENTTTQRVGVKKIGRNDPCWCGSGKKYKHCHGRNENL